MKTLIRHLAVVCVATVLAVLLGAGTETPEQATAQGPFGTNWDISITDTCSTSSGPGGTSQNRSSTSEQTSDDGQKSEDSRSSQQNEDGSSSEQEDYTYDDGKCNKGGGFSRHTTTDAQGNRKVHYQEIWRENGKCEIVIVDELYDKNNNLIDRKKKPYPCSQYKLEMQFEGGAYVESGSIEWGPHKAVIPLTEEDRTYEGSYQGQFNGTMFGECNGFVIYPVSAQVTAVEDEFEDLDFSIELTMSMQATISCPDISDSSSLPAVTGTRTFTLPAQDGASYVLATPGGEVRYTFTLRKQCK